MPCSGEDHAQSIIIAIFNTVFVFDRTTRLNNCSDAGLVSYLYTIRKREKRIAGHNRTFQIEAKAQSLSDGLFQGIYSWGLTGAAGQ